MLICLTASHKNADFDFLEKLSTLADPVVDTLLTDISFISGAVVVATCNRFEAYLDIDEPVTTSQAKTSQAVALEAGVEAIAAASGIGVDIVRTSLDVLSGDAAARHLFAVSSGLESVVVGEGEIAGQVRRSLERARERATTTAPLERVFQRAAHTSRGVRNGTGIGAQGRSIVRLALDLAETRVSDWAQTRVLLIGTGRYAGASLAALRDRGVSDVRVFSPSGRAMKFARSHRIVFADARDLALEAASADIVVTCTTATGHVLTADILTAGREQLAEAATRVWPMSNACPPPHDDTRQLIIDLGLPRNVDPDVATVHGVELLDLETIRLHAPIEELAASAEAHAIVDGATRRFAAARREQSVTPAVVALRNHVYDVLDAEIERAQARGDDGTTEAALRHLAGVLLHTP
ncbi:MAG: glutamyl-tRNA reductase, partial [Gaiellaceae bacterium]